MDRFQEKHICYVCGVDTGELWLLCSQHVWDWKETKRSGLPDWAKSHPDYNGEGCLNPCPKCSERNVNPPDYLCERCRYG